MADEQVQQQATARSFRQVTWTVQCKTLVYTDDDDVARQQVADLFEQRPWGTTDLCLATAEAMHIQDVSQPPEMTRSYPGFEPL